MKSAELLSRLLKKYPDLELKGATMPYCSVNGNMFCFVDKEDRLHLRLSRKERESFLEKYSDAVSIQHGVVMKEYVMLTERMRGDDALVERSFDDSVAYAKTLKPKATRKK